MGLQRTTAPHAVLIGCGNMGGAILKRWLEVLPDDYGYTVITPRAPQWAIRRFGVRVNWVKAGQPLDKKPDIILIAVKPHQVTAALHPYGAYEDTVYTSVVAGTPLRVYEAMLEGQPVVRLMPNTAAAIGESCTTAFAREALLQTHKDTVERFVTAFGDLIWLGKETEFHAATAIAGSGPAYVFAMIEALAQAGVANGLGQELAQTLARKMVSGTGLYLETSKETPAQLRQQVTSPGGTTAAALSVLSPQLGVLMGAAVAEAVERSQALARL